MEDKEVEQIIKSHPWCWQKIGENPNKYKIPKLKLSFNQHDIELFNKVYTWIVSDGGYREFKATPSGAIPKCNHTRMFAWYVVIVGSHYVELIARTIYGNIRYIIGAANDTKTGVTGQEAYFTFREVCQSMGIDLESLAVDNGEQIKETIQSPKIDMSEFVVKTNLYGKGKNIRNCHHLDINSAFMASIASQYPSLREPIEYVYSKRKEDDTGHFKAILTHTYGYMQSKYCNINGHKYALSNLSKAAIEGTNKLLDDITADMRDKGITPLLYNTDGIWYTGDIYHSDIEGTSLGQYKNDYINCTLNIKSKGAYQFEGTDCKTGEKIFKPVFRGVSSYEKIAPRELWQWDDIYKGAEVSYKFDKLKGIINYETENIIR